MSQKNCEKHTVYAFEIKNNIKLHIEVCLINDTTPAKLLENGDNDELQQQNHIPTGNIFQLVIPTANFINFKTKTKYVHKP